MIISALDRELAGAAKSQEESDIQREARSLMNPETPESARQLVQLDSRDGYCHSTDPQTDVPPS